MLYVEAFNPALDRLGQQLADADVHQVSSVVAPSISERPQLFEGVWYTDSNLREFAFSHKILHDVTYDTVLKRRRRALHARLRRGNPLCKDTQRREYAHHRSLHETGF